MSIQLASGSPRRRDLLSWSGLDVIVCPQDIDETWDQTRDPVQHAEYLAAEKCRSALSHSQPDEVVLAADTVVHLDGQIFDKPTDRDEARHHLRTLSGHVHQVTTGVAIARSGTAPRVFSATTRVRFRVLSDAEIDRYVLTGEADDKAGAYAIQGQGGAFVAEVHGSWTNVMGLPLEATLAALRELRP
ncbi:MAG: nucleoside triphosphate pyrophosphatase [Myxococcota bacterium]